MTLVLHTEGHRFESGRAHYFFNMNKKISKPKNVKPSNIKTVLKILNKKSQKTMLGELSQKDPFYILISTVLSARNRDDQTIKAVRILFSHYKTPQQIANAPIGKLEPMLRLTGFYKTKAKRIKELSKILIKKYNGTVPQTYDELTSLPGVGRKTAGCVMVYAFGIPAIPVDTHVNRIANRLGWTKSKSPLKSEQELMNLVPKKYWHLVNEGMVIHGQTICKPITPSCSKCPIRKYCLQKEVKYYN